MIIHLSFLTFIPNHKAFGVVPNLTDVLASMLPMIGMAKLDSYKVSFGSGNNTNKYFDIVLVEIVLFFLMHWSSYV